MKNIILLMTLVVVSNIAFGGSTTQVWKNTNADVRLRDNARQVFIDQVLKIKDGCFRFDSGQLESSNDCITYNKIGAVDALNDISDVNAPTPTDGQALIFDNGTSKWISGDVDSLPDQATHAGEYLTTNGTLASWAAVAASGDVITDETTILTDFAVKWDNVAKKIKQALVTMKSGVLRALSLEGDHSEIQNQNQYGDNYNVANSGLTGGATAIVTGSVVQYTTGTLATSYFVFDDISLNLDKDTQGVIFHAAVSGVEADVAECFVYDGTDVVSQGVKLSGVSGDNLEYSIPVIIPDPIVTGLRVRCNQLTTTASTTIDVSKIQWTTSIYALINIGESAVELHGSGNSGAAITGLTERIDFTTVTDKLGTWTQTDSNGNDTFTAPSSGRYIFNGAVAMSTNNINRLRLYKNNVFEQQIIDKATENAGDSLEFSSTIDLEKDDTIDFRFATTVTLDNTATDHFLHITKVSLGSSKGWANSADMPSNSYWFSTDTAITVNGTYTRAQLIASYGLKEGCSQGSNCEFIDSIQQTATGAYTIHHNRGLNSPVIITGNGNTGTNFRLVKVVSATPTATSIITLNQNNIQGESALLIDIGLGEDDLKTIPTVINAPVAVEYESSGRYRGMSAASASATYMYFTTQNALETSDVGTVENDATNGWKFTAAKDCFFHANAFFGEYANQDYANDAYWFLNGVEVVGKSGGRHNSASAFQYYIESSLSGIKLKNGDTLQVRLTVPGTPPTALDSGLVFSVKALETGFIALDKTKVSEYANNKTGVEKVVGTWFGQPLYEKSYEWSSLSNGVTIIDATLTRGTITPRGGWVDNESSVYTTTLYYASASFRTDLGVRTTGLEVETTGRPGGNASVQYTKDIEN